MSRNTTMIAVAGLIALAGYWSRKKTLSPAMVIGFFFVALFMSLLTEIDEQIAFYLSLLFTVSVSLAFLPELLTRTGLMQPIMSQGISNKAKQRNKQ